MLLYLFVLQILSNQSFHPLSMLNMSHDISSSRYYRLYNTLLYSSDNLRKFLHCMFRIPNHRFSSYYSHPYKILMDKSGSLRKFLHCMFHMLCHISSIHYFHPYNILLHKSDSLMKFIHYKFHIIYHKSHNNDYQIKNDLMDRINIALVSTRNTICNLDDIYFLIG